MRARVLIVVMDGLRRDLTGGGAMPALDRLRARGVEMTAARAAFPSETRVQVSTLVCGTWPVGHGIMGNSFYDPALGLDGPLDTSDTAAMARAETLYGRIQEPPTLPERLHLAGRRYAAVTAGKVGNARLLNLHAGRLGQRTLSIHGPAASSPGGVFEEAVADLGPLPEAAFPNLEVNGWAVGAALDWMIPRHDPDVLVLWLNEPDLTFHYRGLGSPEGAAAIAGIDAALGRVVDWWEAEGAAAGWSLMALSDHGHVTVSRQVDVGAALGAGGIAWGPAIGPDADYALKRGRFATLSVRDRDPRLIERAVAWLHDRDWTGLVFTRDGERAGTLPLSLVNYAHARSADIAFTLRDDPGPDSSGLPGTTIADNPDIPIGGGMHGGLSEHELGQVMVLAGPVFRRGERRDAPCGIVDVAPTVLAALGLDVPPTMTGRPLRDAFADGPDGAPAFRLHRHDAARGAFAQAVTVATVAGAARPYLVGGGRTDGTAAP